MGIISIRKRNVAAGVVGLLLLIVPACTGEINRADSAAASNTIASIAHPREIDEYKNWPKLTVDSAQQISPDEAKAILIARAAIQRGYNSDTIWEYELRFHVERRESGWLVSVGFFKHSGGRVQQIGVVPAVLIDSNWNAKVLPGA